MGFQTNRSNSFNPAKSNTSVRSDVKAAAVGGAGASTSKSIVISGMYDGKPNSKLIAKGMTLKEDIVIPAGYTVKLFQKGGKSKNGKDLPTYELVAQPPRATQE